MPGLSFIALLKLGDRAYVMGIKYGDTPMGLRSRFKKWAAYQQTVRELSALGNRELSDLGINREEIHKVARQHINGL